MADVNSNININFNTTAALAQLRQLQAGLSRFHQSLAEGNLAAANAQKGLNAQLLQSIGATGKFSASQVKVAGSTLAFTSALEKNKLSLGEYFRYTMAAATANTRVLSKAFAAEREIINRARRDRVKALQAQYIQMNKSNAGFMDAIKVMPKTLAMANGRFTELGTRIQYAAQRQQFLNQLLKQGSTQLLNFGKNTQWAGRQLMVGLTMPLVLFGSMAAKTFRELETEIVKFKRVYGNAFTNDKETDKAVENIRRLATEYTKYGVSVTKTVEMAATAAAAGFVGSALNAQVETATKLAVLGQIEQQQALETTISLQSAFGISSEELAKKIDFLNAVENQTLLSIEDLTIAIPKAAPVVKQLGGSVEDLAFFLTAMKEGGINASEGANALKSGLASLINPSDKASKMLAGLGINIKGIVEGNQGDIKSTVIGFAQALDTLDPLNRARAIEQMFGKFQFSRLSTLFQNVTKDGTQASRALDLAGSSVEELAVLSEREMKKIEDSVGVKFQAAVEQFKQDIMPLGKVFLEALTPVVKFFGNLFEKFNGLSDKTKKVIAVIVGVVAGLGPVVLMTFGLLMNAIANGIKLFALLRGGIARLNGQTKVMGAGFNYMTQEQIENAASSQQLHQTHTRLIEVFNVEKTSVNALAASYNALSTQMRAMASQNPALFAGGVTGARSAVKKLPPVRKFKDGILTVPGPKGAGDIQPAMLAPGEAVIPAKTTEKYKGLISAIFNDKVPGFMAGRIPAGPSTKTTFDLIVQRNQRMAQPYPGTHPERKSGPVLVGMPDSAAKARQSREMLEKISDGVKTGSYGTTPPTDFGIKLTHFKGRSFPERGIGGVYRKPNGEIVVVKPTMDEKTALAEVRATEIAREVHGLIAPKQSIRTMIDPTDPTGQRKFIVLESRYDPRIAAMDGNFSRSDMIKQLVASTLRGDRDLQQANVSGRIVADVGNSGVFDRASGFRDFAKAMPSMEEQAVINLLGVKGGAKKFFAQQTSSLAAAMTPAQYDAAIKAEISKSIPKLDSLIRSWSGSLNPEEQIVYNNMLQRLKDGAKVDWAALQPMHARAGNGIVKAITGIDTGALSPEIKEQVGRYISGSSTQQHSMIDELKRKAESALIERLKILDNEDPVRSGAVRAAWEGGKAPVPPGGNFTTPRQSTFLNEISSMTPVNVDGVTKYIHDDDMDSFLKDPIRRTKKARTEDEIIKNLLYRMGAVPEGKRYVAGGKFKARFANVNAFRTDLMSTGKQSGSWKSNAKKEFRKPLKAAEKAFKDKYANEKYIKMMMDAGLTREQAITELGAELSHTSKTGAPGRGPEKWLRGTGSFDSLIINRYMNSQERLKYLLDWNKKNGYSLIPKDGIDKYYQAAAFMAKGGHPTNAYEASLVALAADADLRAADEPKISTSKKTDYSREKLIAMRSLLADRANLGFYESADRYNFGAGNIKGLVLAQLGEYIYDEPKKTLEKITRKNSKNAGPNVKPDSKKTSESRLILEDEGRSVVTQTQAKRLARGRVVTVLPSRDKGNPDAKLTPYQKQELKKIKSKNPDLDDSQARDILRRKLKHEQDIVKSKEKEAAAARKAARRAELLPKQQEAEQKRQTQDARKRYLENQRRQELNRQQALNYDAAVKEGQRRELQATKQKEKAAIKNIRMARQQRIGVASGGLAMGLGMAGSGMMMSGNMGAGMGLMGASAVAGLLPMFMGMGPVGLAVTALIATGGSLFLFNKHLEKSAKKQAAYVDSVSATTNKMDQVGQITKKVGASRAMEEVRKKGSFGAYNDVERAGTGFGDTFLSSEVGKSMAGGFVNEMKAFGSEIAAQEFALQLSSYVSDGVLDAAQAADIADQIGIQLGSRKYTAEIMGHLRKILGPNGEDLANNALKVRIDIVQETSNRSNRVIDAINTRPSLNYYNPVDVMKTGDAARENAAQLAALGVNNIAIASAQADATEFQYRKEIELLEKELASTTNAKKLLTIKEKIATLEGKMTDDMVVANKAIFDQINLEKKRFKENVQYSGSTRRAGGNLDETVKADIEDAYFDALKAKVNDALKETGFESAAESTIEKLAKLSDKTSNPFDGEKTKGGFASQTLAQDFELDMSLLLANKILNPEQLNTFMLMFEGKLPKLSETLILGIQRQGPGPTIELLEYFSSFKNGEKGVEISTKIINSDKKTFNEIGETMAVLRAMDDHEVNMEAFITTVGYDGLVLLSKDLAKIEAMPDKLDKELILEYFTTGDGVGVGGATKENLEILFSQWDDFDKLPDKAQKEAISKFTSIFATIFKDEAARREYAKNESDVAARESGFKGRTAAAFKKKRYDEIMSGTLAQAQVLESARSTEEYIGKNGELVVDSVFDDDDQDGPGTHPLDFLKDLAMGLKQVRDNAFNALKPVESLLAAFTNKKTQKDAFNLFDGIQNRLLKLNVGEDLRGAIESMSAEDFDKIAKLEGKDALFTFAKGKPKTKDTITGLTPLGKAVDQGYKERALGNFNLTNEETIKNIQDQTKAYNILISSGLTAAQALEVVASQGQAAAIASGAIKKGDPDWNNYIKNIKTSNTDLERQAVLNNAIRENEDFKIYEEMPKLASQMKDLGYSTEQIDKVLGDPELAKFMMKDLKDGKLDSADIAKNLNNIEAKKLIDIQVQLNKGNFSEAAELGRRIVDEMFSAEEGLIRTGVEANKIIDNERLISDLEAQIDPFIQTVNKKTEEINDLNRELEMNPLFGDRAIKIIEDENNVLSNDLAIISKAAEEVNKKYEEQAEALSKVQQINEDILDQQKKQIDLADAITSGDISAAARAVQEIRAANAARFASAQREALERAKENELAGLTARPGGLTQEQISQKQYENSQKIYAMENNLARLEIIKLIQKKQDEIYKIEEENIEPKQFDIDKLASLNKEYQASIDKQIAAIKVFGETREDWDSVNARFDYYATAQLALNNPEALAGLVESVTKVDGVWANIIEKMDAYKKGIPDSLKFFQDRIEENERKAKEAKAREDKEESDRKIAEALRKLTSGGILTDEEKRLLSISTYTKADLKGGSALVGAQYEADGGLINSAKFASGAYAKGTDTVPAMLTPGEYVLRKSAVDKYGVDNLEAMNNGYYHKGGPVGHKHGRNLPKSLFRWKSYPKDMPNYWSDGTPSGSPYSQRWGALRYGPAEGKDIWGGTEIPGLKFDGKVPNRSDYWHQIYEQPSKSSLRMGIDPPLNNYVGSGASMRGIGSGIYGMQGLQMFSDGGLVLGGISNFWKKIQSNPIGTQMGALGIGLMKELGTVLQMAGSSVAPAFVPKPSTDQTKSLAEFTQVPGIYRAVTGKSSEGPLAQDSLTAQKLLDWSSVAGLFIPGGKVGATKPITSSAAKSPGTLKKIVTLSKTRKEETLAKQEEALARRADEERKTAEALEFVKNNPRLARPGQPGAPPAPALSIWDDTIDDILTNTNFFDTPAAAPKSRIRTIAEGVGSTIAKPVTVPAKFVSKVADAIGHAWKYGQSPGTRWNGEFDYWNRSVLIREMANRTVGRLAEKINPKLTIGPKLDKLDPREPSVNALSTLQRYMAPETGNFRFGLQYKNIPKNILQNFVKSPIEKAKISISQLKEIKKQIISHQGLSSKNPFIYNLSMSRVAKETSSHYRTQAFIDSIPGGFGALLQFMRGVHRSRLPYTQAPKSPLERVLEARAGTTLFPTNAFGPGNYFATSGLMSEKFFALLGDYQYGTKLTPSAVIKVLQSKGFARSEDVARIAEKKGMPGTTLESIEYNADHPLMEALINEGYLGYRHNDAFTNWMIGLMPGMGFRLIDRPKVPSLGAMTDIPKSVIKKAKGGLVPKYFAAGGYASGTDTVPAMLTPGEFVMSKYAVDKHGVDNMKSINSGSSVGDSVYNYNLNLNVKSDANPDEIARAVMVQIKSVDAQRIRGARI